MKRYNKPTLTVEELTISHTITTSLTNNLGTFADVAGDKSVDFADFGTGEWN